MPGNPKAGSAQCCQEQLSKTWGVTLDPKNKNLKFLNSANLNHKNKKLLPNKQKYFPHEPTSLPGSLKRRAMPSPLNPKP